MENTTMMASQLTSANAETLTGVVVPAAVQPAAAEATTAVVAAPEMPAASSGASMAAGGTSLIIVLLIGFFLYRAVEKKKAKPSHVALAFTAGVLLSGSMVGVMAQQTATSVGGGLTTMFSTVTGSGGHK
ncbi:hypothetical protein NE236_43020 [Actinoallomurus purpureus]|uniref:hypothetical protein n=1 Tax=Actinoallomurus purpureus TaxID=478114 RepID=UPI002092981E|nr:hypothetical protein [Actinoallomurus purpureus]MCO6011740.1 hypothetical protein [Actinoallomurus purpureus]